MLCIFSENDDPYFNLAAEEYFLRHRPEDFFLIWISRPAVITGKHQVTLSEINPRHAHENGIVTARRLSGGGTVYHDHGNLNFTFITTEEPGKLIDFSRHALPVMEFLEKYGLPVTLGDKHDILAGGYKISGNAMHVYKSRVLHHGTLLFSADLGHLRAVLSSDTGRYISRAVQSNRARVANISDLLARRVSTKEFSEALFDFIREKYGGENHVVRQEEAGRIRQLATGKYMQWEWIYGYSPDYRFENTFALSGIPVTIRFTCHKGIINGFEMNGEGLVPDTVTAVADTFNGCRHNWSDLLLPVQRAMLSLAGAEITAETLMQNLF